LAQRPAKERRPRLRKKKPSVPPATPGESLAQRAYEALMGLPAHVVESLAPDEPPEDEWNYMDGVIVAKGVVPESMLVHASHSVRISDEPLALEAWCCPTNQGDDSDAMRARLAWRALCWLDAKGLSWVNTTLFKMHGAVLPALESSTLSFMGELAPLALDVPTVLNWAKKMTAKARAEATLLCGHPYDRKEEVSPRTALENLLSGPRRKAREDIIRDEALELYSGTETGKEGACWWFQRAKEGS
jgi:hypothetical protein